MSDLIVLSGIPGTGKSEFARFIAAKHGFGHVEIDYLDRTDPVLWRLFQQSRSQFARTVRERHTNGAVIDWGFRPEDRFAVEELWRLGARLFWFTGDFDTARANFLARATVPEEALKTQMTKIAEACLPQSFPELQVVQAFGRGNAFRAHEDLFAEIFPVKQ